jgi:hypothetical protein
LTQPVTETRTKNISWGDKGGRYLGLTTLSWNVGASKFWNTGPIQACTGFALLFQSRIRLEGLNELRKVGTGFTAWHVIIPFRSHHDSSFPLWYSELNLLVFDSYPPPALWYSALTY